MTVRRLIRSCEVNRLRRHAPVATMAGFARTARCYADNLRSQSAITHLRDVLGDQTYESLARKGETMSTSDIAAHDQIDQVRADLNAVLK